ncbi:hypothetical protein E4U42_007437 [Claviceps africana]|uniref:Uncharacterized protein n=1 Tax=Claviceps africana TaxID=83212 RepID=A0A8K0JBC8_9HYPO|nr:hypothetical protein E4U42_007437 [Claviceps africana]
MALGNVYQEGLCGPFDNIVSSQSVRVGRHLTEHLQLATELAWRMLKTQLSPWCGERFSHVLLIHCYRYQVAAVGTFLNYIRLLGRYVDFVR